MNLICETCKVKITKKNFHNHRHNTYIEVEDENAT